MSNKTAYLFISIILLLIISITYYFWGYNSKKGYELEGKNFKITEIEEGTTGKTLKKGQTNHVDIGNGFIVPD